MPYVDNLKKGKWPSEPRLGRFHPSGKLWISDRLFPDLLALERYVAEHNASIVDLGYGIRTPYFVWTADLSASDLDPYRAEIDANKIKEADPH